MNLNFKKYFFLTLLLIFTTENVLSKPYLESLIRERAIAEGYKLPNETHQKVDKDLVQLGKVFFESKNLSLNGNVACASCHFNSAASADGLPNAFGIGGDGEGISRYKSGGKIVPRNTVSVSTLFAYPAQGAVLVPGLKFFSTSWVCVFCNATVEGALKSTIGIVTYLVGVERMLKLGCNVFDGICLDVYLLFNC